MPVDNAPLSRLFTGTYQAEKPVAFHDNKYIRWADFHNAVCAWTDVFKTQPHRRYGLYTEAAYPFAVFLFALLHADKEIWLPGNNLSGTASLLHNYDCQLLGDWHENIRATIPDLPREEQCSSLANLAVDDQKIFLFTSGSSGKPKAIGKNLGQLEAEIATLEECWGKQLGNVEVLATVSHQHIYGLLFRVLWPLSSGRCFHSQTCLTMLTLANIVSQHPAYWVASPAHLKRLDDESDWPNLSMLKAIFSSGGALEEQVRQQVFQNAKHEIIEIYGSTETGGIAWRNNLGYWNLFPHLTIEQTNSQCWLHSPYLPDDKGYPLDDKITLVGNNQFELLCRKDRIVKIEEKRVSLTEMEQRLAETPWVKDAHGLKISQRREIVCMVITLTVEGSENLQQRGRKVLIAQLKAAIKPWFDRVLVPRKWLFINEIPLTSQGKIDSCLLEKILTIDTKKYPLVQSMELVENAARITLLVPKVHELIYFPNHFVGYPILPGVIQLAWVEYFGKIFFHVGEASRVFSHLEAVKFVQIIRPEMELTLSLNWKPILGELQFNFSDEKEAFSSGQMIYAKK